MNLIKYKDEDIELDINVDIENETAWLTQNDMSLLFGKSKTTINEHIKNVLKELDFSINTINSEKEDKGSSTVRNFRIVRQENCRTVTRNIKHYNLGVVIAVGYRVNSNNALKLEEYLRQYFSPRAIVPYDNIIIYDNNGVNLSVFVSPEESTVWLSINQIALLFERDRSVILKHIQNIYEEGELDQKSTCAKNAHLLSDNGRNITADYYNLDVIISVGYRVKSQKGVVFRKWATGVLKQYLLKGYSLDKDRVVVTRENYLRLENDVSNIKKDIKDIKEKVFIEPIKERLFFDGQFYDAYEFVSSTLAVAKNQVILVDPYFDYDGLSYLKRIDKNVKVIICLSSKAKLNSVDCQKFSQEYFPLTININNTFHDRFIIVDDICYSLGASLNRMGSKVFAINKIDDKEIIEIIIKRAS